MRNCKTTFLFLFLSLNAILRAQLPETEVWLFSCDLSTEQFKFKDGKNISNHAGYDNQPSFSPDSRLLLWTSSRDSGQTDIFKYDLGIKKAAQLTHTAVSEYSPQFNTDGKYISAVVVEKDSTQRIWQYDAQTMNSNVLAEKVKNVGYYHWIKEPFLLICQIPDPMTLYVVDTEQDTLKKVLDQVGRCLQYYYDRHKATGLLLYTKTDSLQHTWICGIYDLVNSPYKFEPVQCPEGSQDFVVDAKGNIFMAKDTKLYCWSIGKSKSWTEVADFKKQGLHKITRLALSPDGTHLAVVDNPQP